jgi:hypothetical protein
MNLYKQETKPHKNTQILLQKYIKNIVLALFISFILPGKIEKKNTITFL